jgi:membrane-associated PAP2 superfamily phosphatase
LRHLTWYTPALYGFLAIIVLQYSGADTWLASQIYDLNQGWNWRDSWLLEKVLHKSGRKLVGLWLVGLLILIVISFTSKLFGKTQRIALLYAFSASLMSILLISGLKQITMLPCPWDVKGFGGTQAYLYLHQLFSSREAGPQCFPAGHASGGYALFSVYFCLKIWHADKVKKTSFYWLIPALLVGGLFGIAQQLRGAHFLSHDLTTALICWYSCVGLWLGFNRWFSLVETGSKHLQASKLSSLKTLNWLGR